jgi:superfamily I DNA and/or RNA helicase
LKFKVDVLKQLFREYFLRMDKDKNRNVPVVTIGSVDEFQGMESSIVIISLVRSTEPGEESSSTLGFLSVPERINAMVTRARHMLIMVGSQEHFTAGESDFWDILIKKAATRGFQ